MTDQDEYLRELMSIFVTELEEHIATLNEQLLTLEKVSELEQRNEALRVIMGTSHCLKGAARSANQDLMEQCVHQFETVVNQHHESTDEISTDAMQLMFRTIDALEEAGMRLREDQSMEGSLLEAVFAELKAAEETEAQVASDEGQNGDPGEEPETELEPAAETPAESTAVTETATPPSPLPSSPPAPSQKEESAPRSPRKAAEGSVRVPAQKLDTLLAQIGELVVSRRRVANRIDEIEEVNGYVNAWKTEWSIGMKWFKRFVQRELQETGIDDEKLSFLENSAHHLNHLEKNLEHTVSKLTQDVRLLEQLCNLMEGEIHNIRLFPFSQACRGLERTVRDLAQQSGKEIELVIEGGDVQVDRSILEGLKDPLLHLVRNSADHGIESPADRAAAGKPTQATITVSASLRGSQVEVVVQDDGRGINLNRVRKKAQQKGFLIPEEEQEIIQLIFLPGFSTANQITDISGRGVGLDVVKSRIEALHGTLDLTSRTGVETKFTLIVPLTLTTIRCVVFRSSGQTFALPSTHVSGFVQFHLQHLQQVGGRPVFMYNTDALPVIPMGDALMLDDDLPEELLSDEEEAESTAMVVSGGDSCAAFLVDEILSEQDIVVKNLGNRIHRARFVAGATLMPTGEVALVLNAANLVRGAVRQTPVQMQEAIAIEQKPAGEYHLLAVDDSMTTRALMKRILETGGYTVTVATDGDEALQLLQKNRFDLVVTDVDMPNMNGFELTRTIRQSKRITKIPIVLVTSRGSQEDQDHGFAVGANAYLTKGAFDQDRLLNTIQQLL